MADELLLSASSPALGHCRLQKGMKLARFTSLTAIPFSQPFEGSEIETCRILIGIRSTDFSFIN